MDQVTQQLEDEGVDKFDKSYDQLIETLKENGDKHKHCNAAFGKYVIVMLLKQNLDHLAKENKVQRFWASDATLWTNSDENQWMGWLNVAAEKTEVIAH